MLILRPSIYLAVPALLLLLQACAPTAVQEPELAAGNSVPEITLNLPQGKSCECVAENASDYTFLERGFSSLYRGEHADAVEYFRRYRRVERSVTAYWEADVAIAFTYSLIDGSLYDPERARKSYRELRKQDWQAMELHGQTELMRQSLQTFIVLEREGRDLQKANAGLKEDLEKREEAIKRLRELTLGQKGAAQ